MTLYIIGIGLSNENDITIRGLENIKQCETVYLENYTSLLQCSFDSLEKFYGQKIILINREFTENKAAEIVEHAKTKNIAFLVVGDPFSATTHIELLKLAKEKNVPFKVINNASIFTAIGITGLQLYKFGKVVSIPFLEDIPHMETPYLVLKENQKMGLHTLFLLDLNPEQNRFMTIPQALEVLEKIQERMKREIFSQNTMVIGCAHLGSDNYLVKAGTIAELKKIDFGQPPYCLIIPGRLHFMEEETIKLWR